LVEPTPGDSERQLLTVVWRDPPAGARPSIFASVGTIDPAKLAMRRVGRTGVWYKSFRLPVRSRVSCGLSPFPLPLPSAPPKARVRYWPSIRPDPSNDHHMVYLKDPDDPKHVPVTVSIAELPGSPVPRWIRPRRGGLYLDDMIQFKSRFLPKQRRVWICRPPDFDPKRAPYNLLVVFDGGVYESMIPTPRIVANLVAAGRIGPTVVVLVANARNARVAELGGNPRFIDFLARELWPWLRRHHGISVPASRVAVAGSSLGGLTAAFAAFRYSRLFDNVLAQSGAFHHPCVDSLGYPTTIMERYAHAPKLSPRFYLDAGSLETAVLPGMAASLLGGGPPPAGWPDGEGLPGGVRRVRRRARLRQLERHAR
jgi:enterochelin esterase-like enzyme